MVQGMGGWGGRGWVTMTAGRTKARSGCVHVIVKFEKNDRGGGGGGTRGDEGGRDEGRDEKRDVGQRVSSGGVCDRIVAVSLGKGDLSLPLSPSPSLSPSLSPTGHPDSREIG